MFFKHCLILRKPRNDLDNNLNLDKFNNYLEDAYYIQDTREIQI